MKREDEDVDDSDEHLCELNGDGEEYDELSQTDMVWRLILSPKMEDGT